MSIERYRLYDKNLDCAINLSVKERLTTKEALELLAERGIVVSYPTIALWVREGKFEGAEREETPRGAVWYIPRKSVEDFQKPEMGRPPKKKNEKLIKEYIKSASDEELLQKIRFDFNSIRPHRGYLETHLDTEYGSIEIPINAAALGIGDAEISDKKELELRKLALKRFREQC